jgi:hypothetical protein
MAGVFGGTFLAEPAVGNAIQKVRRATHSRSSESTTR